MPWRSSPSRGPMPGEHQQLRRVEGAAGQDHLARGADLAALAGAAARVGGARGRAARPCRYSTPTARLLARRTARASRARRARCAAGPGCRRGDVEHPLARARPRVVARGERQCSRCPRRSAAPAASRSDRPCPGAATSRRAIGGATSRSARRADCCITLTSARSRKTRPDVRPLGVQPAVPAVARGIEAELASQRYTRPVAAVLEPLEVAGASLRRSTSGRR